MDNQKRVKLKGGMEGTSSSVEVKEDGKLVIELYDFSRESEEWFGNDVAFLLTISASDKEQLLSLLMAKQVVMSEPSDRDGLLLYLLQERFADYYAIKKWLVDNRIPYHETSDPWA